ncbi:cation-transporting P-type ATPase [Desulfobulbus propionicus]
MAPETNTPWHRLSSEEVVQHLNTSAERGLDPAEVGQRQQRFGLNALEAAKGKNPLLLFLLQFHQPLVYILLSAILVTLFLQEWVDAGVIFGVVLVNSVIGFVQEAKAVKAIESLARTMITTATVLRGGVRRQIPASELVPGDIVLLQSGDKVPADLRLLSSKELQVDESALTGESVPVEKERKAQPLDTVLADRHNMLYSSTLVTYGIGRGVVVATGKKTEIGRISEMIAAVDILATPLTRKITTFSHLLLYIILALAALTFLVGVGRGGNKSEMFMAAVALAVGAIPEGLPAAVTITLAIGVAKMARRNAIIRKLSAVETLGSTTVICSDKTGTLTQNQMTVQEIHAGGELYLVSDDGYEPRGDFSHRGEIVVPTASPALYECLLAGLLCNDAVLTRDEENRWRVEGDPTEAALVVAANKGGLERTTLAAGFPRIDEIPFESRYQYMATLHERETKGRVIYLKGSVERVLPRCSLCLRQDGEVELLERESGFRMAEEMAAKGLRVLALARKEYRGTTDEFGHDDVADGLTFVGLQAMIDPPRSEAIDSIRRCREAGIHVKMITGDHAITATAIAAQIGIGGERPVAITGRELVEMDDETLVAVAEQTPVFARVAPEQKLRLVRALQAGGHVAAMTGDGVNDAPALRQADIGVAMGIAGTEVAKEAADMLLTDDNFASIAAAVEEGRGVYDNLVKFITWTLPTNLGEGLVILTAVLLGTQLPILPVQILWINMTTAVLLGLMLAFEPKEPGIMARPPRNPQQSLLTGELVIRIFIVGLLLLIGAYGMFEFSLWRGHSVETARTCAVNVFVFGEMFYLFNCRSLRYSSFHRGFFSNRLLLLGVLGMTLLQLLFTYLPLMQAAFDSQALDAIEWLLVLGGATMTHGVIELEKRLRRRGVLGG